MDVKGVQWKGNFQPTSSDKQITDSPIVNKTVETKQEVVKQVGSTENEYSKEQLNKDIEGLNKWLQSGNTHLKFQLHDKLNEFYVQVVNDETSEVVREIPSKKVLDMVAKMHEMVGLLIDEKR